MIMSIGEMANREYPFNWGTHSGIFHCDEVVGIAILEMAFMEDSVHVVRTRVPAILKTLDIVIDIGGGEFDHHMAGFDTRRPTGEKYASAGLVWDRFAEKAILNVCYVENIPTNHSTVQTIKEQIDREIIIPVDLEDNGKDVGTHTFSFIPTYLPSWLDSTPDYDKEFRRVERIVYNILKHIIKDKAVKIMTGKELLQKCSEVDNGILEIAAQTVPWLEAVIGYNQDHDSKINFVIFPYSAGGWAAQSVPPSIEEKFQQLVPFPKEWADGNEKTLPEISGISGATFCHNGLFFARAETKQDVIAMCEVAISRAKE